MKTSEFLDTLKAHQGKSLVFSYSNGNTVPPGYHITEVKNIKVDAVDCGGRTDAWDETIIQLYDGSVAEQRQGHMSAYKALSILTKVDRMRPMNRNAVARIEYSNAHFHTAQLFINDFEIQTKYLIFNLAVQPTDCKAKEVCGIPEGVEESSCTPGSGCC